MCDQISDAVLDAIFEEDPNSRVACETMVTTGLVVVAGEISTQAYVDIPRVVRDTVNAHRLRPRVVRLRRQHLRRHHLDRRAVARHRAWASTRRTSSGPATRRPTTTRPGAGDQGMMFGYACDETDDLMPMPIWLAHRLAHRLSEVRKAGVAPVPAPRRQDPGHDRLRGRQARSGSRPCSSRPSTRPGIDIDTMIKPDLIEHVIRPLLPEQFADDDFEVLVQPDRHVRARWSRTPTAGSPAARSSSTPTAAWPATVAARSAARTRRRSTARPPTRRATWRRTSSRPASRSAARCRSRTRSASPARCRSWSRRSAPPRSTREKLPGARAGALRPAPGGDHRAARPAPADLPEDRGVRPLRSHRARRSPGSAPASADALAGRRAWPDRPPLRSPANVRVARVRPGPARRSRASSTTWSPTRSGTSCASAPSCGSRSTAGACGAGWSPTTSTPSPTRAGCCRSRRSSAPDRRRSCSTSVGGPPGGGRGARCTCSAPRPPPNAVREPWPGVEVAPGPGFSVAAVAWPPAADRRELVAEHVAPSGSTLVLVPEGARLGALRP